MIKKRVYIHQIQSQSWKNLLPLSAGLLTSWAGSIPEISREYDFEIDILRRDPSETVSSYSLPDVLAFSVYSWNFRHSLEVARMGKLAAPESLVVFGGPMIPNHHNYIRSFLQRYPFIDIIVHSMGEWAFSDILMARLGHISLASVSGISYRNSHGFIKTTEPVFDRDLTEIPSPFLNGTFDTLLALYGEKITGALWETNRGCPYSCTFCVQGNSVFSKILRFSKKKVYKELEWISSRKISYLFCTDANFGILPRDLEIAEKIAHLHVKTGYPEFFIVNWLKNSSRKMLDIVETLRKGGVYTRLTLSLQSTNEGALSAVKRKNIPFIEFQDLKRKSSRRGVTTYTELIIGLPEDTYDTLMNSIARCVDRHLSHFLVVYLCRLLDGTEMADPEYRARYGIETRSCRVGLGRHEVVDSGIDEREEIVVSTSTLTVQDWEQAFTSIYTSLLMYNFRIAFFIFNFLRTECGVNFMDLIEFIIQKSGNKGLHPVLGRAIEIINECRKSILDEQTNLVSLTFTDNMLFEAHEAALLSILEDLDVFYVELWKIISSYLESREISFHSPVLKQVFEYQAFCIPTWKTEKALSISFDFNIPQYFNSLCLEDKKIDIIRKNTLAKITGKVAGCKYKGPAEFARSRLTVSSFQINEIEYAEVYDNGHGN